MKPTLTPSAASYDTSRSAAPMKYPTPFSAFLYPVSPLTSLNSVSCFSSGVTSFVTVFPPSLVRSFATPHRACAAVT